MSNNKLSAGDRGLQRNDIAIAWYIIKSLNPPFHMHKCDEFCFDAHGIDDFPDRNPPLNIDLHGILIYIGLEQISQLAARPNRYQHVVSNFSECLRLIFLSANGRNSAWHGLADESDFIQPSGGKTQTQIIKDFSGWVSLIIPTSPGIVLVEHLFKHRVCQTFAFSGTRGYFILPHSGGGVIEVSSIFPLPFQKVASIQVPDPL